jgi:formylglycine-generating enzyme required for sulfatase activity
MVAIPAGEFQMGTDNGHAYAKPVHTVHVAAFKMDATEVTVQQYRACVDAGACLKPKTGTFYTWGKRGKDNHPINGVSWKDADDFCRWKGKRLPTEAEWEYAARGTEGRRFPWGVYDEPGALSCWNRWREKLGTCAVGDHPDGASPYGLHDMAGNVWEWTSSKYRAGYHPGAVYLGARVLRGGSWMDSDPKYLETTFRHGGDPSTTRDPVTGFRCAR